jgi:hypothetical protein
MRDMQKIQRKTSCQVQAKGNLAQFEQHLLRHDGINLESYFKGMDQFKKAFEYMNNQECV